MRIFLRKLHRWLGLLMALQIIAWMASGLWFSLYPIEEIRGEHLTAAPETLGSLPPSGSADAPASPANLQATLASHFREPWTLSSLELVRRDGALFWRARGTQGDQPFTRLVSGDGEHIEPRLGPAEARERARSWMRGPASIRTVEWIEAAAPDAEFRGRDLPLWKVSFSDPESLNLYLDPWTGEVAARRTGRWRIFDFFWMLHIMDFEARDDFNHPLLQIAAFLGLVIALGGVALWVATTPLLRRRKRVPASQS